MKHVSMLPKAIALDRLGNVYVADWGNHRIQKLSPDGAPLGQFGTGNLYVADSGNDGVERGVVIEVANPPAAASAIAPSLMLGETGRASW